MSDFERHKLADCLIAQAHLCERMAGACTDATSALKFKTLARECREAAKEQQPESIKAEWPAILALRPLRKHPYICIAHLLTPESSWSTALSGVRTKSLAIQIIRRGSFFLPPQLWSFSLRTARAMSLSAQSGHCRFVIQETLNELIRYENTVFNARNYPSPLRLNDEFMEIGAISDAHNVNSGYLGECRSHLQVDADEYYSTGAFAHGTDWRRPSLHWIESRNYRFAFRYLHANCASHGGSLTEAELSAAQAEIIDSFSDTLDYFELIHKRCMDASGVSDPATFAQGRMSAIPAVRM